MEQFGVKAVALRTGINAHTLRIWERRYGLVAPTRTPNGRRVYSRADVERLCLVAYLVSKGHAASRVATLSQAQLEAAVAEERSSSAPRNAAAIHDHGATARVDELLLTKLIDTLESFHLRELSSLLAAARMQMGIREMIFGIVTPLLARIGQLVADDKLSIAHEHALSAVLKTHIYQMMYAVSSSADAPNAASDLPSITVATMEGDFHEFGILLASLLMSGRGFPLHYFGANMPAGPLAFAANALRSSLIVVGKTLPGRVIAQGRAIEQRDYLKELDRALNPSCEIWLGGVADPGCTRFKARHTIAHLSSLEALDRRLAELAAKR